MVGIFLFKWFLKGIFEIVVHVQTLLVFLMIQTSLKLIYSPSRNVGAFLLL